MDDFVTADATTVFVEVLTTILTFVVALSLIAGIVYLLFKWYKNRHREAYYLDLIISGEFNK